MSFISGEFSPVLTDNLIASDNVESDPLISAISPPPHS